MQKIAKQTFIYKKKKKEPQFMFRKASNIRIWSSIHQNTEADYFTPTRLDILHRIIVLNTEQYHQLHVRQECKQTSELSHG